eukprot:TRINITY_DN753_c0_g1_i1.p1 TRINITY_DN753_c0_g1~~TRINITY_DN753_c0_g1_i1.p1  ORF type:complete len:384 (-),score=67.00 TRINITY_DN753_c0_g1_i1:933-2084(-)
MKLLVVLLFALGLASAAKWQIRNWDFAAVCMAVTCSAEDNCLAPAGTQSSGNFVYQTRDFGVTWSVVPAPQVLMWMAGFAKGQTAVLGDVLNVYFAYQQPGGSYNFSEGLLWGGIDSQSIEGVTDQMYAAAGTDIFGKNGVALTADGGIIWTMVKVSQLKTSSRYVAIPTTNTIYLSAGEWPEDEKKASTNDAHSIKRLTQRIDIQTVLNGKGQQVPRYKMMENRGNNVTGKFAAQIVKSNDGGKTWVSQFYSENEFYFNEVDCGTADNCCAIGEADGYSSRPGVRIYCTQDGGANWKENLFVAGADMSGLALRFVSPMEAWATGGNQKTWDGHFWHTQDAGKTWSTEHLAGVYANDLACLSGTKCLASAFNFLSSSSMLILE